MTPSAPPPVPPSKPLAEQRPKKFTAAGRRTLLAAIGAVSLIGIGAVVWSKWQHSGPGEGFTSGNGRIEATEIDVATKLAGRVKEIMVNEGDFVEAGQSLARMQVDVLEAQRNEARAESLQAVNTVASAEAQVAARQSDTVAAQALGLQRESELDAMQRRFARSSKLSKEGVLAVQGFEDDRVNMLGAEAALAAAKAQVAAAQAAIVAAQAEAAGARSGVTAANATIARVEADIQDSHLKSPRAGRVQYRVAEPGEVLAAGGKVLNLVDLSDVYMTFFLPETVVGRVALGSDVHLVLDAAKQYVIPAKISYVASTAQFTPKTVETDSERQKLMFRVKAQINRDLLLKHLKIVKTGVPGIAWLKIDPKAEWPPELQEKLPPE